MHQQRRRRLLSSVFLLTLAVAPGVRADEAPAGLQGTWRGPWYLGMTSGTATLLLNGDPVARGTLQLTNHEKFGAEPLELRDVAYDGAQLRFRVRGADGRMFDAQWAVAPSAPAVKAFASYGGYKLRFELTRVAP